jgi:uncharacterized radical SAM superfamily Fe-S cluster-containing enzyme
MLDVFVASEGEAEVVMLSGGEPTIHPQIIEIVELCRTKRIKSIFLNTNGIRMASDLAFVNRLSELSVNIYLQFDGFRERTHREIRGRDLRARKRRALDNCAEAGLEVALVAAVERGMNEDEVGDIIRFGIEHPAVRGIAFQPVTHAPRPRWPHGPARPLGPALRRLLRDRGGRAHRPHRDRRPPPPAALVTANHGQN